MQRLPREGGEYLLHAFVRNAAPLRAGVQRIADQRVTEVFEVNADLVSAARAQNTSQQRRMPERFDDGVLRRCRPPAAAHDRHAFAIARIASDRTLDRSAIAFRLAVDDREIFFPRLRPCGGERSMRGIVLRDDHQAAGVLIETMNDARTELASDSAQIFPVKEKGVDERAS